MKKLKILLLTLVFTVSFSLAASASASGPDQITYQQAVDMALKNSYALRNAVADIERTDEVRDKANDNIDYIPDDGDSAEASKAYTRLVQADISWLMSKKALEIGQDTIAYAVKQYYNAVLQAQEKKNLADLTLENEYWQNRINEFKYQVGMLSGIERINSNSSYSAAKDSQKAAEKALDDAYHKFNQIVGMPVDSRTRLSDQPEMKVLENINLETEVNQVVSESYSVWQANQEITLAKLNLELYTFNDSSNPDTYKAKEIDVEKKENSAEDTKKNLAQSVRTLYYNIKQMEDQYSGLQAKLNAAEQSSKIMQVKFDIGMATKADLISAQLAVEQLQQQKLDTCAQHDNLLMAFEKPWVY